MGAMNQITGDGLCKKVTCHRCDWFIEDVTIVDGVTRGFAHIAEAHQTGSGRPIQYAASAHGAEAMNSVSALRKWLREERAKTRRWPMSARYLCEILEPYDFACLLPSKGEYEAAWKAIREPNADVHIHGRDCEPILHVHPSRVDEVRASFPGVQVWGGCVFLDGWRLGNCKFEGRWR